MPQLPSHCRLIEENTGSKNEAAFRIECEGERGPVGAMVARIKIHKKRSKILGKTVYTVAGVNVDERYQRRGLATLLYEAAAREACRRRARLASTERNHEARSLDFWLKQERKGRAVRVKQKHKYGTKHGPGFTTAMAANMVDAFMLTDCGGPTDLSGFKLPRLPHLTGRQWAYVGAGALALLALVGGGLSYGGAALQAGVDRDPKRLLPAFAKKVEKVFQAMRARGYDPILWEGYRTPERAAHLAKIGTGITDSMHSYGAAVDIVDNSTAPRYWDGAPGFWTALGEEYERQGITWGGRFSKRDLPHGQGVTVAQQNALRAATPAERAEMVA